jgi:hypothetical protein
MSSLDSVGDLTEIVGVRTLTLHDFTREFTKYHHDACLVTSRGRVIGSWEPLPDSPKPIKVLERVKKYCKAPLPFTGAQVLKETKKR